MFSFRVATFATCVLVDLSFTGRIDHPHMVRQGTLIVCQL